MTQPTSASEYRARAQAKRAEKPTEIVPLQSGNVFELRRPDLQAMVVTGRVPQSLVAEGMAAWKKKGIVTTENAVVLGDKEVIDSMIFMREIVCETTVNPHFVEFVSADNEIGPADILKEDFDEIFAWAMGHKGVTGHEGLESFREGRERGVAGDSPDGAELQPEAEPTVAN